MKKKIYIAGPYSSGNIMYNIRYAIKAGNWILENGGIPFIPHLTGFWDMLAPHDYEIWMSYDVEWLKSCDAVYRLPGESSGADRELAIAKELGIPIFFSNALDDMDLIDFIREAD